VVAGLGIQTALLLDAASFLLVSAVLLSARLEAAPVSGESWRTRLAQGLAYVRRRPILRRLLSAQAIAFVFFAAVIPIEIVYAKETLDAGSAGYGALLASWGIGMVAGSLLFAGARKIPLGRLLFFSTLAVGGAYLGLAAAGTLAVACVMSGIGGAGNGVQWVSVVSAVQEMTAGEYQARVIGLLESLGYAMPGVGFVLGGVVADLVSPRATFLVAGAGVIAVVIAVTPLLRRTSWEAEESPERGPPEDRSPLELGEPPKLIPGP
jgi:MFS family permease